MNVLKEATVNSNKVWTAAGKPRQGPIFNKRQLCKAQYRKGLRKKEKLNMSRYTNHLHEALLAKKMVQLFGNVGTQNLIRVQTALKLMDLPTLT